MKNIKSIILIFMLFFNTAMISYAQNHNNMPAQEALNKLKEGNKRFVASKMKHPDETAGRRKELQKGQHPFVAILSCSDSRVPPEVIFDQGLGDLFEIRNAGNVLDEHVIGSIEYAVAHAGVKLVVIMGHEDCGAVTAALGDSDESVYIKSLTKSIKPAIKLAKKQGKFTVNEIARIHAKKTAKELVKVDPIIKKYVKNNGVQVVPAYYHLDTGVVEFME